MVRWARTSYGVAEDGLFRFRKGVLVRSERLVPLDRIQDVSQVRKLRHRVLGVVALRIETAGGGKDSDVVLDFVTVGDAAALAEILGARTPALPVGAVLGGTVPEDLAVGDALARDGGPEFRLGPVLLAVGGITGAQLASAPVALFGLLSQADDVPNWLEDRALGWGRSLGEVVVFGVLVVAAVAVAAVLPVVRYHGFVLRRVGGDLTSRRGLFEQRAVSVPLGRVQSVRVVANPVRRLLGLARVLVDTTARAGGDGSGRAGSLGIPILSTRDLDAALELVLPNSRPRPTLAHHPGSAKTMAARRAALRLAPVALVVALGTFAVAPLAAPVAVLVLGVLLFAVASAVAAASYRLLGHASDGRLLWSRRGLFSTSTEVVVLAKVQGTALTSSPGQRRRGLCSVVVYLASRQPMVVLDVDPATGANLVRLATRTPESVPSAAR